MGWMTAAEAAREWGVTPRRVQVLCAEGRIAGAERFGRAWRIPGDAPKPADPRRAGAPATPTSAAGAEDAARAPLSLGALMPLMATPFAPGRAEEAAASLPEGAPRDIARAELAYFGGRAEDAAAAAEPYLGHGDPGARLSACLICAYANLSLGRIDAARRSLDAARDALSGAPADPRLAAAGAFVAHAASVLLHLPAPASVSDTDALLPLLSPGLRAFALYVRAHAVYLSGDYARSLGIAEAALLAQGAVHPIPSIYLRLVAVMDLVSLRRVDEARAHLLAAWELAHPDGLIEGFAEHHGLLGGMLEAVVKPAWPDDFRRIIDITYRFSAGWRRVHNPATGDDVADNLTTTEFAASMLAARDWTNAQIAEHLGVSVNTVKSCLSASMRKLGVSSRRDLARFMLA
ncbi:helix-turn-helix domain-containing protein [Enorma massiliensis]|uniref:HTH luxR-type domain-containing protein n=1 Tax=Enorma massiliensis TaxID=1472761 RepID=A0A1Y3U5N0_9ACTN|nr:helix-turn-helix domain-containing protein [Enorma massiliensis]OUN44066.1 hypothetical protein B5G21_01960 [Enorma massiliensis]